MSASHVWQREPYPFLSLFNIRTEQKPDVVPPTEPVKTEENGVETPKAEAVEEVSAAEAITEILKAGNEELTKTVENIVPLSCDEGRL